MERLEMIKKYNSVHPLDLAVTQVIDEIYDNFESRTCKNCKHYDGSHTCLNNYSIAFGSNSRVYPEDGCNIFEIKTNKNKMEK